MRITEIHKSIPQIPLRKRVNRESQNLKVLYPSATTLTLTINEGANHLLQILQLVAIRNVPDDHHRALFQILHNGLRVDTVLRIIIARRAFVQRCARSIARIMRRRGLRCDRRGGRRDRTRFSLPLRVRHMVGLRRGVLHADRVRVRQGSQRHGVNHVIAVALSAIPVHGLWTAGVGEGVKARVVHAGFRQIVVHIVARGNRGIGAGVARMRWHRVVILVGVTHAVRVATGVAVHLTLVIEITQERSVARAEHAIRIVVERTQLVVSPAPRIHLVTRGNGIVCSTELILIVPLGCVGGSRGAAWEIITRARR